MSSPSCLFSVSMCVEVLRPTLLKLVSRNMATPSNDLAWATQLEPCLIQILTSWQKLHLLGQSSGAAASHERLILAVACWAVTSAVAGPHLGPCGAAGLTLCTASANAQTEHRQPSCASSSLEQVVFREPGKEGLRQLLQSLRTAVPSQVNCRSQRSVLQPPASSLYQAPLSGHHVLCACVCEGGRYSQLRNGIRMCQRHWQNHPWQAHKSASKATLRLPPGSTLHLALF